MNPRPIYVIAIKNQRVYLTCPKCNHVIASTGMGSCCFVKSEGDTYVFCCHHCNHIYTAEEGSHVYDNIGELSILPELIPPDRKTCQAEKPNPEWSPFRLGPCPKRIKCEREPVVIIEETKLADDGAIGSMSLCIDCYLVALRQLPKDSFKIVERVEYTPTWVKM